MDRLRNFMTAAIMLALGSSLALAQELSSLPDPDGLDSSQMIANAQRAMSDMGGMVGTIVNLEKQTKTTGDSRAESCVHTQLVLANSVVASAQRSQFSMEESLSNGQRSTAETYYRAVGVGLSSANSNLAAALACVGGNDNQEEEVSRSATDDSDDSDIASLSDVTDVDLTVDLTPTTDDGGND